MAGKTAALLHCSWSAGVRLSTEKDVKKAKGKVEQQGHFQEHPQIPALSVPAEISASSYAIESIWSS